MYVNTWYRNKVSAPSAGSEMFALEWPSLIFLPCGRVAVPVTAHQRKEIKPMLSTLILRPRLWLLSLLFGTAVAMGQSPPSPPTLKSILLEQLRGTHGQEEWFVPVKIAIEGLTPEQAAWKDQTDN